MTTAVTCISPEDVDVDTGMVILTGVAGDAAIIRAAGELAGRVAGVGAVDELYTGLGNRSQQCYVPAPESSSRGPIRPVGTAERSAG
jgi:hypothetical protein